jgi:5-methylcytosine-specific restriction endonuclease McrA
VRSGVCRDHANAEYRAQYAAGGKLTIAPRVRARARGIAPLPQIARDYLTEQFQGRCAYCGLRKATTWDHILPVARGGETKPGNIVPACVTCNSSKKARPFADWMNERGFHDAAFFDVLVLELLE